MYHRELLDHLVTKKGLRELYDFEWKKNMRVYIHEAEESEESPRILLKMFNMEFSYGTEFFGAMPPLIIRPQTERVVVCTAQVPFATFFSNYITK